VSRGNIASLALKSGLRGATDDPLYRKLQEYGSKLYPRFDRLMADPEKETGIDPADDVYTFFELSGEHTPGFGVLFGISDRKRFAEFVQRIRPGAPETENGFSTITLDREAVLYWNGSFALIYAGRPAEQIRKRALAVMTMGKGESIAGDPVKKKWLEGRDDCRVSFDMESLSRLPEVAIMLRRASYKPETYVGSSLTLAANFDKGKFTLDSSMGGAALLNHVSKLYLPPSKEFLAGIPVGSYLGFLAARFQPVQLLGAFREANPDQYARLNDQMSRSSGYTLEQLADSLTGDVCLVLDELTGPGGGKGSSAAPSANTGTGARPSGTVALGIKPDGAVVKLVNKVMAEAPGSEVRREGKVFILPFAGGSYLLADNGYLAFSTRNDTARSLATRKQGDKPAMPSSLLSWATTETAVLELRMGPLLTSASASERLSGGARKNLALAGARLRDLRCSSHVDKDRATSKLELLFADNSKNSLKQIAEISAAMAEPAGSGPVR
jgi:hypothetical protein